MASGLGAEQRLALVVGNAVYGNGITALVNPVNDAADMAALLTRNGFTVTRANDVDLAGFEDTLARFKTGIKAGDTVLFFYAGHAVQVQGENYLIPVREDIRTEAQVRSKAVSVGYLLDTVKDQGAQTCLLFLDACRDNPFVGSSRSGARGLQVQSAPKEMETLIAYATEPGDTAADGDGRNGLFTQALLRNLAEEGLSIVEAMTRVRADVMKQTGGKQRPRTDVGLSRSVVINDPALAARSAEAAMDSAQKELDELNRQMTQAKAALAGASLEQKRQLELDMQKQQAALKEKEVVADRLAREEQQRRLAAQAAERLNKARSDAALAAKKQQEELALKADAMRKELELMQQKSRMDNPDGLVGALDAIPPMVADINARFDRNDADSRDKTTLAWKTQIDALDQLSKEPWESKAEFKTRMDAERANMTAQRDREIELALQGLQQSRQEQLASMETRRQDLAAQLNTKTFRLEGSLVDLQWLEFNDETKDWSWTLTSKLDGFGWRMGGSINLAGTELARKFRELEGAIKSRSLSPWIEFTVDYVPLGWHVVKVTGSGVRNLASGEDLVPNKVASPMPVALFKTGAWDQLVSLVDPALDSLGQDKVRLALGRLPEGLALRLGNNGPALTMERGGAFTGLLDRQLVAGVADGSLPLVAEVSGIGPVTVLLPASPDLSTRPGVWDLAGSFQSTLVAALKTRQSKLQDEVDEANTIGTLWGSVSVSGLLTGGVAALVYGLGVDLYSRYKTTTVTADAAAMNYLLQDFEDAFNVLWITGTSLAGVGTLGLLLSGDGGASTRIDHIKTLIADLEAHK